MASPSGARRVARESRVLRRGDRGARAHTLWVWACVVLLAISLAPPLLARPALIESEPNDTPETFNAVSGEVRIIGTLPPGDQDGFRWSVSDVDAARPWTFTLQGIPGALTIVEVMRPEYADDGITVSARESLFTLASRDGSRPGLAEGLLFDPGEYLLGLARAGGGGAYRPPLDSTRFGATDASGATHPDPAEDANAEGYRLTVAAGPAYRATGSRTTDTGEAQALRPGRSLYAYASETETWFSVTLAPSEAEHRWDLVARVPVGRTGALTLVDADGRTLTTATASRQGELRLPELTLDAGEHRVRLNSEADSLYTLALEQAGLRVAGEEAEPNDTWALANRLDLGVGEAVSGRFQRARDDDYFALALDEDTVAQRLALTVDAEPGATYTLCLLERYGKPLQCRTGEGPQRLGGLVLAAGRYGVHLGRGAEGMRYTLRLLADGAHDPALEAEPNDTPALATSVASNRRIKGTLAKDDVDFIRFDLSGPAQLWRFQVMGDGIHEVAYHDGSGRRAQVVRAAAGQRRVVLDNLFLLPGTHYIAVSGRAEGEYTVLARELGAPDPDAELEPNDDATRMQRLRIGQTRSGTLPDAADRDNYRFHLADHDHIRLDVRPPADGRIRALLEWEGTTIGEARPNNRTTGEVLTLQGVFPPGDYRLQLIADVASEAEYALALTRLERYACPSDCEPNNNRAFANAIPADGVLQGHVGAWRDDDWYALPVFDADTAIAIAGSGPPISLVVNPNDRDALTLDRASGLRTATIPAGEAYFLYVRGDGEYRYGIEIDGAQGAAATAPDLPPALDLVLSADTVAAYRDQGQRVDGRIGLVNPGSAATGLRLHAVTSDARWQVQLEREEVLLAAGASATVGLRVLVPDDAWADHPIQVSVAAYAGRHLRAQAGAVIAVDTDTPPVQPHPYWPVPEAMRGGFNLAWSALGGRPRGIADTRAVRNLEELFDGRVARGQGLILAANPTDEANAIIVELAGDGRSDVAGFALNPLGRGSTMDAARRFEVALSDDGARFTTVLRGEMQPLPQEQYFPLATPQPARFARLTLIDNFSGRPGAERMLGEWKVVARPGDNPFPGRRLNLADPELGGHVVRARPLISQRWDDVLLLPESADTAVRVGAGEALEWVIGFEHNRAALLDGVEWLDAVDPGSRLTLGAVEVAVSLESPAGPWEPIADWQLDRAGTLALAFDTPRWARFVRFRTPRFAERVTVMVPAAVRILEHPTDDTYRSILGEWSPTGHRAIFESLHPPEPPLPFVLAAHDRRDAAAHIAPGETVRGHVWLDRHEHWYRLEMPDDRNTLGLELAGETTVRTVLRIENAAGEPIATRVTGRTADAQRMEAFVGAGETVFLKLEEPPRNVVFAWDTSASVGAFLPLTYNAMMRYAEGLVPGRDAANLMPFGAGLLLDDWFGEPHLIQQVLNEYPREESSSEAEQTLARASQALGARAGAKAIVLITDAATNRDASVWDALDRVRPRIMALGLDSTGAFGRNPRREQDLMQDWARVNAGHYAHLRSDGEMEVAFDRVAALLREPAPYRLTLDAILREEPQAGSLRVRSAAAAGPGGSGADRAIGLILDASGSMLQRMEGVRRIEIARRGLIDAVNRHIAPGTPVALRVFGHREPNACRSDLEIALGPLDPAAATRLIERIEARHLARTPIADSLALMASDLAGASGPKTVVLVTDGEETCEGDPGTVIRQLLDRGVDVRLNIIGFALDDTALEARFRDWAELGGGAYYSAGDAESFGQALRTALQIPYAVVDRAGVEVARGLVDGDPIAVPAGVYRILLLAGSPRDIDEIRIPADTAVEIGLD
jgi:hypothetical protein